MNKSIITMLLLLFTCAVEARTDCPAAKIRNIQIEGNGILYLQEGASWRFLGAVTEVGMKERYSAMLAAQMAGRLVMVGYTSDTYNCAITDYSTPALLVRTYDY